MPRIHKVEGDSSRYAVLDDETGQPLVYGHFELGFVPQGTGVHRINDITFVTEEVPADRSIEREVLEADRG